MTLMWIFVCTYPMFYTADMCDVTYIGVYNTYLHGKCFLSALYNDKTSHAWPHSKLIFVPSEASPRVYATSQSNPVCADQRHISCRNTMWFVFDFAANTHGTCAVFLWQASAENALLRVDWAGMQLH